MKLTSSIIDKCKDEDLKEVLKKLSELNRYYSLLDGDIQSYIKVFETVGKVPAQYKEWLKIFNGGFLFSVSMFSTQDQVYGKGKYLTFAEVNSLYNKLTYGIPDNVTCFAMAVDGDYYCFESDDSSGKIYEWDIHSKKAIQQWNNYSDWLSEQINIAKEDINDGILEPMED